MEGFVLVTNPYYRWYFISFWTIAVVVILNLVIAFVLEAFFNKDEQRRSDSTYASNAGASSSQTSADIATINDELWHQIDEEFAHFGYDDADSNHPDNTAANNTAANNHRNYNPPRSPNLSRIVSGKYKRQTINLHDGFM